MDIKTQLLLGITGTIICFGGYTAFSSEKKNIYKDKIKNIVLNNRSKTPDIEMITINEAIEKGYTSESFDLTKMSKEDNRQFDIAPLKPYLEKGMSFDQARLKLVQDKIKNIPN